MGFGRVSLAEYLLALEGAAQKEAHAAWVAGHFARFAYHQPNDYPEEPGSNRRAPETSSPAEIVEAKAIMASWAARSNP